MTFAWNLPRQHGRISAANLRLEHRKLERVLLEYDGPQLIVLRDGERRYLGYVADEIEGGTRWLQVPVSGIELKALHLGKRTLREALAKSEITIYDRTHSGEIGDIWLSPPASIPDDCLPAPDVELPKYARDPSYQDKPERVAFECEGSAVGHGTITFDGLAAVTGALQRLWFAIARKVGMTIDRSSEWNDATLAFAAGGIGSFAIQLDGASRPEFETIARGYKALVRTSYRDPHALDRQLAEAADLSYAYGVYAEALETHGLDIFADWDSDAVFFGNDRAKQLAKRYGRRTRGKPRFLPGDPMVETVSVDGYFDGLMRRRPRFEFVDPVGNVDYGGEIAPEALDSLKGMDVVLGRHTIYRVLIEVTTEPEGSPRKPRHVLLRVKRNGTEATETEASGSERPPVAPNQELGGRTSGPARDVPGAVDSGVPEPDVTPPSAPVGRSEDEAMLALDLGRDIGDWSGFDDEALARLIAGPNRFDSGGAIQWNARRTRALKALAQVRAEATGSASSVDRERVRECEGRLRLAHTWGAVEGVANELRRLCDGK